MISILHPVYKYVVFSLVSSKHKCAYDKKTLQSISHDARRSFITHGRILNIDFGENTTAAEKNKFDSFARADPEFLKL